MLAAFFDANFACIPHVIRFFSAAALVRIGLDHLSLKKGKKNRKKPQKNKALIVAAQGGGGRGCFLLVQHTNHKSKTKKQHKNNLVGEHYTFH